MEQTTLYYQSGSSDKVYQASIQPQGHKYSVQFAYGRRGATMQTGTKTPAAVDYDAARAIYDGLLKEKMAKGYSPGEAGTPYQHTDKAGEVSGVQCQLLNPIDDDEQLAYLIAHPEWWMQQKFDGKRLLVQKLGDEITGINRRGLRVTLPETLVRDAIGCPVDFLLDGEAIGDQFHVFDLLQVEGSDFGPMPYLERYLQLMRLLNAWDCRHIIMVQSSCTGPEKLRMFEVLKAKNAEGVVFKHITEPYTAGRPASGGSALKFKFHETASFVVSKINGKRSVALLLFDGKKAKPAGNVTIPANLDIPSVAAVVEVRYLYAFRESGCIYQPVYLGVREDITREECTVDQLKYKPS